MSLQNYYNKHQHQQPGSSQQSQSKNVLPNCISKFYEYLYFVTKYLSVGIYTCITGVLCWFYTKTITDPLRLFYFVGPIWKNLTPEEICFELTGVDSSWWNATIDRKQECDSLLSKKYVSFEATILCMIYFIAASFMIVYMVCRCCFLRPILNELRMVTRITK
jgi:hypothetical protein